MNSCQILTAVQTTPLLGVLCVSPTPPRLGERLVSLIINVVYKVKLINPLGIFIFTIKTNLRTVFVVMLIFREIVSLAFKNLQVDSTYNVS